MRSSVLLGVGLIMLGSAMLGYRSFSYKTEEQILEVGPLKATAERTKTIDLPPILAWACISGGAGVLILTSLRHTS